MENGKYFNKINPKDESHIIEILILNYSEF